jgi:hypothetical protein
MTSKVEIANLALGKLGANRIVSFSDDSEEARAASLFYLPTLRAELRRHPWSCAKKRTTLAPTSSTPLNFAYAFNLPTDCLRVLKDLDGYEHDWEIQGRQLLTDETDTLELPYIYEITDPNIMDPLLVEAFACKLAMQMTQRITQSRGKKSDLAEEYKEAIAEAKKANAFERAAIQPQEDPWIQAMR